MSTHCRREAARFFLLVWLNQDRSSWSGWRTMQVAFLDSHRPNWLAASRGPFCFKLLSLAMREALGSRRHEVTGGRWQSRHAGQLQVRRKKKGAGSQCGYSKVSRDTLVWASLVARRYLLNWWEDANTCLPVYHLLTYPQPTTAGW